MDPIAQADQQVCVMRGVGMWLGAFAKEMAAQGMSESDIHWLLRDALDAWLDTQAEFSEVDE